jgi:phage N-6-adenine-methyltransferase
MKGKKVLHSSASTEWATPQDLFDQLQDEFKFDLDAAASPDNAKCETYFTKEDNGLSLPWSAYRVWLNPPYGREIGRWVEKACEETLSHKGARVVVMLVPARTDTRWWKTAKEGGAEIRFLFGRLKFGDSKSSAPFPSAILIFRNANYWRLS